jgi:hypothetical protein
MKIEKEKIKEIDNIRNNLSAIKTLIITDKQKIPWERRGGKSRKLGIEV